MNIKDCAIAKLGTVGSTIAEIYGTENVIWDFSHVSYPSSVEVDIMFFMGGRYVHKRVCIACPAYVIDILEDMTLHDIVLDSKEALLKYAFNLDSSLGFKHYTSVVESLCLQGNYEE